MTNEQKQRWIDHLQSINKYKSPRKTQVTEINKSVRGDYIIFCADELSMYRIAQAYNKTTDDYGYSFNLGTFYVYHNVEEI